MPIKKILVPDEVKRELQQQFNDLQRDWETYKKSSTITRHCRNVEAEPDEPVEISDDKSLSPSEGWGTRDVDRAVEEVVRERRAAIKSGRLKGRCLLEALEKAAMEENGNVCSSELIQGSKEGRDVQEGNGTRSPCCCTTSSFPDHGSSNTISEEAGELVGATTATRARRHGRWTVVMTWATILAVIVVVGYISLLGFSGEDEVGDWLAPT